MVSSPCRTVLPRELRRPCLDVNPFHFQNVCKRTQTRPYSTDHLAIQWPLPTGGLHCLNGGFAKYLQSSTLLHEGVVASNANENLRIYVVHSAADGTRP